MTNNSAQRARCLIKFSILLVLLVAPVGSVLAQCDGLPGCVLVWSDEFDGTEVDTSKWTFQLGDGTEVGLPGGWGNNELQYYQEENTTVAGGLLTITAREESVGDLNYTSSRMRSLAKGDWTFGRMEMRARMPIGQGMWPAFWMLPSDTSIYGPWAASGEIDIMEYLGDEPDTIFGTIHYGASFPGNVFSGTEFFLSSGTFNDDFHVFAIEWEFGEIRWYVDGVQFASRDNWFSTGGPFPAPFDVDFHLLLNMAVGGNLPGPPDATTVFPQEFVVDYVRVYQVPNNSPLVEITSPAEGDVLSPGDDLTITVNATDDGAVQLVQFLQDNAMLGEDDTAPYELTVPNIAAGCYSLKARARDDAGKLSSSAPVDIMVGASCTQAPYLMTPSPIPGTIEAENYDLGGQGLAYNDSDLSNNGGAYRPAEGVDLEATTDVGFGFNVGFIIPGEWIEYQVDVTAGTYDVQVRVASAVAGGTLHLEFDGVDKTGPINFADTGDWQSWTTATATGVTLDGGVQTMRLSIDAGEFNVNKITIGEPEPPGPGDPNVFDDMEHGNPLDNGWFVFDGSVGGGGIGPNSVDLPPVDGGVFSLDTGWGSGGVPGFFGGFGRTNPTDLRATTHFNFWINPDAGQDYTLEINLQDDDDGDDGIGSPADDEFQYNCTVSPTGPCAVSGGGWQLVSIPLADFFDDNSMLFGGNGVLDPIPTSAGGNGQLINVVFTVIGNSGSDASFLTDYWNFSDSTPVVWDDFEDGDAFDWVFFGGNNAGGGGVAASDRPQEGGYYLSTGWGGQGSASVFYGGMFKNVPEADQLTLPADPWLNIWVLNQSNATVDQYTMEVTIREDLDGNGWTNGLEDSFRLDTVFPSSEFDDEWTLVSAPLSSFVNLFTGGDGTFNGKLDEMVIVVSGVQGVDGATVELDLDYIALTGGGPLATALPNIEIEKATNGVDADDPNAGDAPQIAPGDLVSWTYVVTNTGDGPLANIVVTDDQGVAVSCPLSALEVGQSMICTASGIADDLSSTGFTTVPGLCGSVPNTPLYENTGTASGESLSGQSVEDTDPSHYCNPPVVNRAPVATDNDYTHDEDTTLSGNVITDGTPDSDADGDSIRAVLDVDSTTGGLLSFNPDGSFSYDPADDYCNNGSPKESFTYYVNDGPTPTNGTQLDSNTATVTITITCLNDPPVITALPDESVAEDSGTDGAHTVNPFATASPGGGVDEAGQTFTWNVTNVTNTWLFSADPSIDSNGVLTYTLAANANGSSTVTVTVTDSGDGTNTSGPDSFEIVVTPDNDLPGVTSVSSLSQTVDYSDNIATVIVKVTDIDNAFTMLAESGEPTDSVSSLSLTEANPACDTDNTLTPNPAEIGSVCTWTYDGQVLSPGDNTHDIVFTASDADGAGAITGTHELTIEPEDAMVMLDSGNDVAAEVATAGGNSGEFKLFFSAYETDNPDFSHGKSADFGDLDYMVPTMSLIPVGPGGPEDGVCSPLGITGTGYEQVATFECTFDDVPVNTYEVQATIDGASGTTRYYIGTDDDVFTLFDPSLGFTSGGGWFYWPGTDDETLTDCGPDGYLGDKTNFGFNLNYNKKRKTAKGSVLVMRHTVDENCLDAGSYRVKSNAIEGMSLGDGEDGDGAYGWAAVAGKSTYREPGLDNEGNHPFLMYVEDHGQQGCEQSPADEFWIEVKDKDGAIVMQLNGPEPASPNEATDADDEPIVCGNITVPHKTGKGGGGPGGPNPNKPPKG